MQSQGQGHHGQSASISNFATQAGNSPVGATTVGGMLAPSNARSSHSRAVSLPAFAPDLNGLGTASNSSNSSGNTRGHQYQSSFSGLIGGMSGLGLGNGSTNGSTTGMNGFGNGYGLAIQEGGLNGWAEEEVAM